MKCMAVLLAIAGLAGPVSRLSGSPIPMPQAGREIVPRPAGLPADCNAPRDSAIATLCSGEELLRQSALIAPTPERDAIMRRAALTFRQAANSTTDAAIRKRAL